MTLCLRQRGEVIKENRRTINNDGYEVAAYPLRMTKSTLKVLKVLALKNDTTVKDLNMTSIFEKWKI